MNNKKFDYFQYKAYFSYVNFSQKTIIKYLQLYLSCFNNNQFENYIKKALDQKNLFKVQIFYIYKITEIIIVYKNKNLMFVIF